ncbi:MAG: VOC family protein, partial [Anaerolineales bacterium]
FYTQVFDWEIADSGMEGMQYWMISTGKDPGGGMMAKPPEAPAYGLSQYFLVDDIDATLDKVTAAGGQVCVPKTEITK